MSRSKALIAHYKKIYVLANKAEGLVYCGSLEKAHKALKYTDAEKEELDVAADHFAKAMDIVNKIYEKKIGQEVGKSVRYGEWK